MTDKVPVPENEAERLEKLDEYNIMDSAPEIVFDEITELAAEILQCPVSFIQFMDEDRQWFKSKYGLPDESERTELADRHCGSRQLIRERGQYSLELHILLQCLNHQD